MRAMLLGLLAVVGCQPNTPPPASPKYVYAVRPETEKVWLTGKTFTGENTTPEHRKWFSQWDTYEAYNYLTSDIDYKFNKRQRINISHIVLAPGLELEAEAIKWAADLRNPDSRAFTSVDARMRWVGSKDRMPSIILLPPAPATWVVPTDAQIDPAMSGVCIGKLPDREFHQFIESVTEAKSQFTRIMRYRVERGGRTEEFGVSSSIEYDIASFYEKVMMK